MITYHVKEDILKSHYYCIGPVITKWKDIGYIHPNNLSAEMSKTHPAKDPGNP